MQRTSLGEYGTLRWEKRSAFKSEYDLHAGDAIVGEIVFRGVWKLVATGKVGGGCWTFSEGGIFRTRAHIRRCESPEVIGTFQSRAWRPSGTLTLHSGARFHVKSGAFRGVTVIRTSEDAPPLLTFAPRGFWHAKTHVDISASASSRPELPLLVLFGQYRIVCLERERTAAAAA